MRADVAAMNRPSDEVLSIELYVIQELETGFKAIMVRGDQLWLLEDRRIVLWNDQLNRMDAECRDQVYPDFQAHVTEDCRRERRARHAMSTGRGPDAVLRLLYRACLA